MDSTHAATGGMSARRIKASACAASPKRWAVTAASNSAAASAISGIASRKQARRGALPLNQLPATFMRLMSTEPTVLAP